MSELYQEFHVGQGTQHIVLLHGWGMNASVWHPVVDTLLPLGNVTLVDLPGLGRSADLAVPESIAAMANRVEPLVPKGALIIGWSLGGLVATELARRATVQAQALMLVASNPCFVERAGWPGMRAVIYQQFKKAISAYPDKTLKRFCLLQLQGEAQSKSLLRTLQQVIEQNTAPQLAATLQLLEEDGRQTLDDVQVPVLHLLGSEDQLVPASLAEHYAERWPEHQAQRVEGAGHVPFLSQPEAFYNAVRALMSPQGETSCS